MIKYESGKAFKHTEVNDYEQGCLPDTSSCWDVDIKFSANTKEELIEQIKNYYDVTNEDIMLNSCDEPGRIDIQILEDENSFKATEHDKELWKQGKKKLWLSTYTYYARMVTTERIKF